ncbi:SDR family NAD(P)-dependent oxidoreductase [Amycolatopsis magusensis]|uniref:SDR family NAD(P)-dependent oxidoreductase n=1 Tax=Amycolatopsis magusensis TaxID=882444 RepID=UPI003C2E1501
MEPGRAILYGHQEIRCRLVLRADNPIVDDHRVHGVRTLPGVTFLDLVCRALTERGFDLGRVELRNVLFVEPVVTTEEFDREIDIEFLAGRVVASSRKLDGDRVLGGWTRHLEAELRLDAEPFDRPPLPEPVRTSGDLDGEHVYEIGRAVGIEHREFMKCGGRIHRTGDGLLSELALGAEAAATAADFVLHPALLDASTMQVYALAFDTTGSGDRPLIPMHITSFRAGAPLGEACRVDLRPHEVRPGADVVFADITLGDSAGNALARFEKLMFKRVRSRELFTRLTELDTVEPVVAAPVAVAPAGGADLREELADAVRQALGDEGLTVENDRGFYELGLDSTQLLGLVRTFEQRWDLELYPTLLFEHSTVDAVADYLADKVTARAPKPVEPEVPAETTLLAGEWEAVAAGPARSGGKLLAIGAEVPAGLPGGTVHVTPEADFRTVLAEHRPDTIVHFGPIEPADPVRALSETAAELLALVQAVTTPVTLVHFSGELVAGALPGLAATIHAEQPGILAKVVESPGPLTAAVVTSELAADETWVRRDGSRRWVRRYREHTPNPVSIRAGGVYLISGGSGALGRLFAEHLSAAGGQVVLFGRTAAEVPGSHFLRGDVTVPADVERVVRETKARYGRLDGVVHAAGVLRDSLLVNKTVDELHAVLAPKLDGTRNLAEALRHEDLDFFALFSSITGVVGNVGQADYAVANGFLNAYARSQGQAVALSWPFWRDGGMAAGEAAEAHFRRQGQEPLTRQAGIEAFTAALGSRGREVVVLHGDRERATNALGLRSTTARVVQGTEDIAIIGVAGRYPGARDLDELWQNLLAGTDSVTEIPAERWSQDGFYHPERRTPGRSYSRWGGFLDGVADFDPAFFQITPREAATMDPQERLFLQTVWHTMEDAGLTRAGLAGSRAGVFVGVMFNQYQLLGLDVPEAALLPTSFSSSVANRVSYFFDFHGPSLGLDTMCSSSLTAIHLACQSLRAGDCEVAFAGGVNVASHPYKYLYLSQAGFVSSDGRCRSFGAGGDGYVPGEGVGAVLLKPLDRALADGDRVHAVIRGSAVNHGGRASGYTVPNPVAQERLIAEALQRAGVAPDSIGYLEAHGTGTSLGDPIELSALAKVFGSGGAELPIGSIKSNLGHLEPAAGIAGLTKVLLQFRHRTLVPSLHADPPNPAIDWDGLPFRVQRAAEPWTGEVRRAGVSAFGAGGANGHVVLEEFAAPELLPSTATGPQVVLLSAKKDANLRRLAQRYLDFLGTGEDRTAEVLAVAAELFGFRAAELDPSSRLADWALEAADLLRFEQHLAERLGISVRLDLSSTVDSLIGTKYTGPSLADLAYSTQVGRDALEERVAFVVESISELGEALSRFVSTGEATHRGTAGRAEVPAGGFPEELAAAWVRGASPDWRELHTGPRCKVDLPLYPFSEVRCWVETQAPEVLHTVHWRPAPIEPVAADAGPVLVLHDASARSLAEQLAAVHEPGQAVLADLSEVDFPMRPRTVYFLGGLAAHTDLAGAEDAGVLSLLRWARRFAGLDRLDWKIVTSGIWSGQGAYAAGLAGAARVLEHEHTGWSAAVLDFEGPIPAAVVAGEPAERGVRARHVDGVRYLPELREIEPGSGGGAEIRPGGVYVIIGGAGGIGLEIARELVREQARVAVLGRSERPGFAEAGVTYVRADATDETSLRDALAEVHRRLGRVHGVVHAALVPSDHLVRNLDEDVVRAGLAAKSRISVNLAEVFAGEPLDFVLFFSSAQSFLGDPGLAAYAAGSTFQDSFAHALDARLPCVVRSIDWGFWGTAGSMADGPYRDRLTRAGFGSITPASGWRTVLRALRGEHVQVVAVPGADRLLRRLGVPAEAVSQEEPVTRASAIPDFHALDREMAAVAGSWLLRIVDELGGWTSGPAPAAEVLRRIGVTGKYRRLGDKVLDLLAAGGFVVRGADGLAPEPGALAAARRGGHEGSLDRLAGQHPEYAVFVRLLALCLSRYPELLRGDLLATDLLFPRSGTSLMEGVYKGNPISDVYNDALNDTVVAHVVARLPELAAGEKVRILEVGSGTGGTSAGLAAALAPHGERVEYFYTDLSVTFLEHGKQEYGTKFPFLRFKRLDADRELAAQGFPPGEFDLVIGANVIHATRDLRRTLGNLKAALRPGGRIVLNELTTVTVQATVTYGLFEGWWSHDDTALRLPGSPLLDLDGWTRLLGDLGYLEAAGWPAASARNFQHVISARSDGAPLTAVAAPARSSAASLGPFERDILALTSEVSGIAVADLDLTQDLGDVGFDSISYSLLATRLNDRFGFDLSPAIFYETATLRALITKLAADHPTILAHHYPPTATPATPPPTSPDPTAEASAGKSISAGQSPSNAFAGKSMSGPEGGDEPIAVIGMAGLLPGSADLGEFWQHLLDGDDLITEVPATRWDWRTAYARAGAPGPVNGRWGGFIDGVEYFDPLFFGISPAEAEGMDPQQRLFLQTVWAGLERAGIAPGSLAGSDTGLFVGVGSNDYQELQQDAGLLADAFSATANAHSILVNRISYLLDLRGPSEPVNTGCSSSLVALHRAAEAIRRGDCDLAVAGGVNLILSPRNYVLLSRTGMLSPDGRCKTFDASANGFVRGEGTGAVVLTTRERAEAGGHRVLAWLRGSAVNHGGRARSLTAPNPASQAAMLVKAYTRARIDPATVGYIETHGTGTELGDPVEVSGLKTAFAELSGRAPDEAYCALGALKSSIGHLESAAGIAGVLKVLLAMEHRTLPRSLHLKQRNPYLQLDGSPFRLLTETTPWQPMTGADGRELPRRAGVSSFGYGGVNAHVVLEEAAQPQPSPRAGVPVVVVLSAKTPEALRDYAAHLEAFVEAEPDSSLPDIAYTLQVGRDAMPHRLAVVAGSRAELLDGLRRFREQVPGDAVFTGVAGEHADTYGSLFSGDAGAEFLRAIRAEGDLGKLARLWTTGLDVDWRGLGTGRLFPLPTYPFARRRCWFTAAPPAQVPAAPAPVQVDDLLHLPVWVPDRLLPAEAGRGLAWVVAAVDADPLADALESALAPRPVVRVRPGAALPSLPDPAAVFFLGGVARPDDRLVGDQLASADEAAETGVLSLFRIVQHLFARPTVARDLALTVVSSDAWPVGGRPSGNPHGAQLWGFAKSLRRESPAWRVATVDVGWADLVPDPAAAARAVLAVGGGAELAFRDGTPYRQVLEPAPIVPVESPLRDGGGYVIVGGAGEIGLDVAEFLVRRHRARVALVGRSELTDEVRARIAAFDPEDQHVRYFRADAADSARLRWVAEEFGQVHGVIHAANVLRDRALHAVDEGWFREGLESKTRTSAALVDAFGKEPLDFLLFFSSVQSFLGNPGQSGYAAACAFQDAYAHYLAADRPFPVKVIDWGAWGERGLAARYRDRLDEAGVRPIAVERGVAAMVAALGRPEVQVAVVDGTPEFLGTLGAPPVEEGRLLTDLLGLVRQVSKAGAGELDETAELSRFGFDSIAYTQLSHLCNEAFGLDLTPAFFYGISTTADLAEKLAEAHPEALTSPNTPDPAFARKSMPTPEAAPRESLTSQNAPDPAFARKSRSAPEAGPNGKVAAPESASGPGRMTSANGATAPASASPRESIAAPTASSNGVTAPEPAFARESLSVPEVGPNGMAVSEAAFARESLRPSGAGPDESLTRRNGPDPAFARKSIQPGGEALTRRDVAPPAFARESIPVAVVGMAGMLPQSDDLDEFWAHLAAGRDLVTEIPADRWDWRRIYGDPAPGEFKTRAKWGGFLRRADLFDPLFFGISPREAEAMDPQHRLFLEAVWSCLEDAAIRPSSLAGTDTAVYLGNGTYDYFEVQHAFGVALDGYNTVGRAHSIMSNRVSYLLDLHGPSETIDTACSSSLVAIHRGVEAIRRGECELAFAGGVNVIASPTLFVDMSQADLLSPDGRCKTFDAGADGIARAEGVGVVLLKALDRALADGDVIHGVIRGSAVNHGGRTNSLTAPNPDAQAAVVAKAHRAAGVDPRTITFIETHGTGTSLGDPVEIDGLKSAFRTLYAEAGIDDGPAGHCALGALKSNMGHLEAGAGVAGLLKVLLAMRHGTLPKNLHIDQVNPYIRVDGSPFRILREAEPWQRPEGAPRRAGVSSFGLGGVNAHLVVEEHVTAEAEPQAGPDIFVLSAKDGDRLRAYAQKFANWLENAEPDFAALAHTLQTGREEFDQRLAIVAEDLADLTKKLTAWLSDESDVDGVVAGEAGADGLVLEGEEGRQYLRAVLAERKLDKLARLWTRGIAVDWSLRWGDRAPRRIPLPTYPFARESYWITPGPGFEQVEQTEEVPQQREKPEGNKLEQRVTELLAGHLGVAPNKLRPDRNLAELGVDSLGLRRLSRVLGAEFGWDIPARFFATGQSIRQLTAKLVDTFGEPAGSAPAEPEPGNGQPLAELLRGLRSGDLGVDDALRKLRGGTPR